MTNGSTGGPVAKIGAAMLNRILPMRAETMGKSFDTWTLDTLHMPGTGERECKPIDAASLDEAIALATPPAMAAAHAKGGFPPFVILETDDTAREGKARQVLHFFTVKVRREWRAIGPLGSAAQAAVPYAVMAGSMAMDAFEPRRPFRAGRDDPANGRQPGEARMLDVSARR